jgi:hypothetical protein|tara:strand:+ start:1239 stop:1586 length:348 start_codon:yes stop_codon:yes gene_type:complete
MKIRKIVYYEPDIKEIDLPSSGHGYIYFLVDHEEVVYVGQTIGIVGNRVESHRKDRSYVFDTAFYITVKLADLDATERHYIKMTKPKYNIRHNQIITPIKNIAKVERKFYKRLKT